MKKVQYTSQNNLQEPQIYQRESKVVKDDKKFNKFIKWAKKNRRKAERFNEKIKKQQILRENQNYIPELFHKKTQSQQEQLKIEKTSNPSIIGQIQKSRKNSVFQDTNGIKQGNQLQNDQIRKESQVILSPQLKEQNAKKISQENLQLENDPAQQLNTSSSQKEILQKKKEKEYNDFKLQIRREMMVDDSIGGKLSYKLMLKMEQFFERHQLKNPKEKEKIINHLHYVKDESTLQKPLIEQEGAYKDDKDFIRRDSYWANLFQAENNNYSLRTPAQFQNIDENDLHFPLNEQKVDIYISETIQDKINKINSLRFQDKISKNKQIMEGREQLRKQLQLEKEQKALEQKLEEEVMQDLKKRQQLKTEEQQLFDQQFEEFNKKQQIPLNSGYSINQPLKNTKVLTQQNQSSINFLTTTATQETPISLTNNSQINSCFDALQSKRNYSLGIDNLEFEKICNLEELKRKKSAINKLYEKLFPQQVLQNQNEKNHKSRFFKGDETQKNSMQNLYERNSLISSPQGGQSKQQSQSQLHKLSKQKSSLLLDQQFQSLHKQNSLNVDSDLSQRNSFSRRSTIQLKKEKEKKQQQEAPAKLQKQYQTYFQLNNIPYMSELGLEHGKQLNHYATILEDYCPKPFEKLNDLNDIIVYYEELRNPELVKNKIYSKVTKPSKPRFELKKYDEIEFLQKKVNFQYRDNHKADQLNTVDQNQNQILCHNLEKRIKSFSTKFIKRPQTVFYKEKKENLTQDNKQEFEKVSDLSNNLSKMKLSENKSAKVQIRKMQKFSNQQFLYTPQEQKHIQYIFPPYPLEQKEEGSSKTSSMIFHRGKQAKQSASQRIQSALLQAKKPDIVKV